MVEHRCGRSVEPRRCFTTLKAVTTRTVRPIRADSPFDGDRHKILRLNQDFRD